MSKQILVIGSGISGLASAAMLAKEGFDVTVIEKNKYIGGRAATRKINGHLFDLGPSWYLMPDVFDKFFLHFDHKVSDFLELKEPDPMYRVFFENDNYIDIHKGLNNNKQTFESIEKGSYHEIQKYIKIAKKQYDISIDSFLYKEIHGFQDIVNKDLLKNLSILKPFTSLDKHISSYSSSEKIKKLLAYTMLFLGGDPKNTPALYSLMSYIDYEQGVYYPMGGFGEVVKAIETIAKNQGVKILLDEPVEKIVIKNGKVSGVQTNKKTHSAGIVVSTADYAFTEMSLITDKYKTYPESSWKKKTIAPSAFLIHASINKKLRSFKHHNLFMSNDWDNHFNSIFHSPSWPKNPSMYISMPSKTDPSVALPGCETMTILVPVASSLDDNDSMRKSFSKKVIAQLEKQSGEKISAHIKDSFIFSHRDFIQDYNAYKGSMLGLSHTLLQTAFFRPNMKSKKIDHMYYAGQYTQPGVGVPMCLISAELIKNSIISNE